MTNFLDCYSGIDWPSVFDGTYDAEHPEGRWFDPVKIWTRNYWEFVHRPVDPTVLQDPALWELFVIMMLAAGYSRDDVTDERLRGLANSFFIYLKDGVYEAFGALPRDVFAQYRDFVHQESAPSDQKVIAFWQATIPNYPDVYRDALDRWRVDTIGDLVSDKRRQDGRPGNGPFSRLGRLRDQAESAE